MRPAPARRPRSRTLLATGLGAALVAAAALTAGPAAAAPGGGNSPAERAPLVVQTAAGAVEGSLQDGFRTFEGVRYAEAPVGDLRFRPPVAVQPFDGVADATAPSEPCAQLSNGLTNLTESLNEDCLFLNVTTPAGLNTPRTNLPVMVWIHGGAWVYGQGAIYDAQELALQGDVVVVTINYRLGPFGFLAQSDLSSEQGPLASGSAALLDQQAALRWVERNIAGFGGDPRKVTIFGESAGASSVCAQLASPSAAGLFDRAIAQSYSCTATYDELAAEHETGDEVAAAVGCSEAADVASCLRNADPRALLEAWPGGEFVVGGSALPIQPADALASGNWNRVPVMHGNLQDENTLFTPLSVPPAQLPTLLNPASYGAVLQARFGDRAGEVAARYPLTEYGSPLRVLAAIASDTGSALSTCEHVDAYETLTEPPRPAKVYAYQFRDQDATPLVDFGRAPFFFPQALYDEGAQHASELPYLFPGLFDEVGGQLTAEQEALSTAMVTYWTNFAASGNPNGKGVPTWHRYQDPADVQGLDVVSAGGIGPVDVAVEANCAFWATP